MRLELLYLILIQGGAHVKDLGLKYSSNCDISSIFLVRTEKRPSLGAVEFADS
jgi:hypothetical protein